MLLHTKKPFLTTTLLIAIALSGCQVVSVKQQATNVAISNERNSILTNDKLSEASLNVLSMTGSDAKTCSNQPSTCVDELKKIPHISDEQLRKLEKEKTDKTNNRILFFTTQSIDMKTLQHHHKLQHATIFYITQ